MTGDPKINVCAVPDGRRGLVLGFAVHEDHAYAVGGQGWDLFYASTDGATFKPIQSPGSGLRSVFAREDGLWVVGEYGYIARSNDRGATWAKLASKSRACLFGVAEDDQKTIWFAGEGASLWSAKDGTKLKRSSAVKEAIGRLVSSPLGVLLPTDKPGHLFFIKNGKIEQSSLEAGDEVMQAAVTPAGTLVAAGLKGQVYRSEDKGKTFTRIKVDASGMLTGVDSFADGRVVIVGDDATLLISNDDGKSFSRLDQFATAGTLWCVKRYREALLVGGEDGLVIRLGELAPKTQKSAGVVSEPTPVRAAPLAAAPANPVWAAPAPSTALQEWTPPPPKPLEIVRGIYVTPELRAMLYPRRGGIATPTRPLPSIDEAWGSLRRALWAADRATMARAKNERDSRSGIWARATSHEAKARRLGERMLDPKPHTGTFDDDTALVSLTFARYQTFISAHQEIVWESVADFVVASVGLPEAIRRMFAGLDNELPYSDVGPFGRVRELMALADDATHAEAKRAVIESLERESARAQGNNNKDRFADLHWTATFLLPLGPGAGDDERRVHDAAMTSCGEFGNFNVHACGLASGDLASLETYRKKNRRTRHEFFASSRRMFLASMLELEGSGIAESLAHMKPADPFDDDPHYNGAWCKLLAHIADEVAWAALHKERKTKNGRIWGTAGLLLAARSDPKALTKFAEKMGDRELVELIAKGVTTSEVADAGFADVGEAGAPFPYEPPVAVRPVMLTTKVDVPPELTWRDEERALAREHDVYDDGATWDGVSLRKCTPEAIETFMAHREKWAIPTEIVDLACAPASIRSRLLALGFHVHEYWARFGMRAVMLSGGIEVIPMLIATLASSDAVEAGLAAAQPVGHVAIVPAVAAAFAGKKNKAAARSWMLRHPKHAAAGAVALVAAGDADGSAARVLRYLDGRGKREVIMEHAAASDALARVREILESDPLAAPKVKLPVLPKFATHAKLPALVDAKNVEANEKEVSRLLLELAFSNADEIHPGVIAARAKYTAASRAAFAWTLFESWLAAKAEPKDAWCMQSVGFFGNDECARKLATLAKAWPGEGASVRAQAALDALLNIGTDAALVNINLLAEKSRYPAFKLAARERISAIADARGLSTDELQDRLVPTLGLDESATLDFGARKFTIEFDEQLMPVLRDEKGTHFDALPKPTKADNAALAKTAKERFTGLKKDARASASLQVSRLERAMRTGRLIGREIFLEGFATHPWMRFLARRLVWETDGTTFRVAEDGSLANIQDDAYTLPKDASVRVAHPLTLSEKDREAWSKLFGDYAILQPFPQLGRAIFTATDRERASPKLERHQGKTVTYGALRGLESRGWEKWIDDAVIGMAYPLAQGEWVVLHITPGWHPGDTADTIEPQTVDVVTFYGGEERTFGKLSPIAFSELVYDLERVVSS